MVFVYVNGGPTAIGDAMESLIFQHLLNAYQMIIMFIYE